MAATDGRKSLGRLGEDLAAAYLEGQGYALVTRNWRTRAGELDIIARDGEWLVFVEVRSRRAAGRDAVPRFGTPADSVTPRKQMQLAAMAEAYLFEMPHSGPWRIDVIALELDRAGHVTQLEHYRDAVGG
jgi:putative endonuclease